MEEEKISERAAILENELPEIIQRFAKKYNILPYIDNPDFLEERLKAWHQFGLLTHTKKVREVFLSEMDSLFKEWGITGRVEEVLYKKIRGLRKKELLEISIPLHDLGKIPVYGNENTDRGHELVSKSLLHEDFLKGRLKALGLSEEHIAYLGRCIESHDLLGKQLRDTLKHEGKLNLDYISEKSVGEICKNLAKRNADIKTELGIFFLCDLLGKTDIRIKVKTCEELENKEQEIEKIIRERALPAELKKAVMQLPANLKLAEIYLKAI